MNKITSPLNEKNCRLTGKDTHYKDERYVKRSKICNFTFMSQTKILVVDDEIILREYLTELLELEGFSTLSAGSVAEAIGLLKNNQSALVISDLFLGQSSGMEILEHLKLTQANTPCYIMSADLTEEIRGKCMQAGAKGLIKKPFDNSDIISLIKNNFSK